MLREEDDLADVIRQVREGTVQRLDNRVTFATDKDVSLQILMP